jgi:hypothetical protein
VEPKYFVEACEASLRQPGELTESSRDRIIKRRFIRSRLWWSASPDSVLVPHDSVGLPFGRGSAALWPSRLCGLLGRVQPHGYGLELPPKEKPSLQSWREGPQKTLRGSSPRGMATSWVSFPPPHHCGLPSPVPCLSLFRCDSPCQPAPQRYSGRRRRRRSRSPVHFPGTLQHPFV